MKTIKTKKWKYFISLISAISLVTVSFFNYSNNVLAANINRKTISDNNTVDNYSTGGLYSASNDTIKKAEIVQEDIDVQSLASSFDITKNSSTARYFPQIGDQGEMGSCTAWASTYYQFTYEVNKFKGVSTTPSNCYSPTWTYNYINGGADNGSFLSDAYSVLENQGAVSMSDMPYQPKKSDYSYEWSTDIEKMLSALQYRVSTEYLEISSSTGLGIKQIKQKIASGHVAVVHTTPSGWSIKENTNGEQFVVRNSKTSAGSGHYITVVGYDDNIQITVNGTTLTGAFKIANSWGSNWGNDGYIWISYDAINKDSAYDTNWQSEYESTRQSVFPAKKFYFMTPYRCSAEFCECVRFTSNNPYSLLLKGNRGSTANVEKWCIKTNLVSPFSTKYIVFDYGSLGGSFIRDVVLSSQWTMQMSSNASTVSVYKIQSRLVDNKNQEIEKFDSVYGKLENKVYTKTHNVSLAPGRISTYDNNDITNQDVLLLQNYLLGNVSISSLQRKLADYNYDGAVDGFDLAEMREHIAAVNGQSLSLSECIDDVKESVIEELNENGVDFYSFMSGELAIDTEDSID